MSITNLLQFILKVCNKKETHIIQFKAAIILANHFLQQIGATISQC